MLIMDKNYQKSRRGGCGILDYFVSLLSLCK